MLCLISCWEGRIFCLSKSLVGFPLSLQTIQQIIAKRQDLLQSTHQQAITAQRCDPNSLDHVKYFINNIVEIQNKYFISKDHLVNADETLLHGTKESCHTKWIKAKAKSGGSAEVDSNAVGSLTPFVSASGLVWLLVLCLKLPKSTSRDGDLCLHIPVSNRKKRSENSHVHSGLWILFRAAYQCSLGCCHPSIY